MPKTKWDGAEKPTNNYFYKTELLTEHNWKCKYKQMMVYIY